MDFDKALADLVARHVTKLIKGYATRGLPVKIKNKDAYLPERDKPIEVQVTQTSPLELRKNQTQQFTASGQVSLLEWPRAPEPIPMPGTYRFAAKGFFTVFDNPEETHYLTEVEVEFGKG
jgi:hypothetical protein